MQFARRAAFLAGQGNTQVEDAPLAVIATVHVAGLQVTVHHALPVQTAEELLLALERGASRALPAPGATPLLARDPAALWKLVALLSLLLNGLLVFWLAFLPK